MLIAADHLWRDGALWPDHLVETDGGQITGIRAKGSATPDLQVHVLMPGCSDLQVNGGGGVMLNDAPTPETMATMAAAHRGLGTAEIMPTLITDAPDVLEAATEAAIAARGAPGVLGLHIEGPHINPRRRGTHAGQHIRPLDAHSFAMLERLRGAGVPIILTLAPELAAPGQIARLRDMGVIVSAGHSAATAAETAQALDEGVTMFTHLFNAMPPMLHRDPGLAAAAILSQGYCGLIADGIHVAYDMLRIAMAARPRPDRCFLVSDAMATVGGPDHFTLYGKTIHVADGALVNDEGSLAGAHTDMLSGLANLVHHAGVPLAQAIAMTTDIPRAAIGLAPRRGVIEGASLSGLVALDPTLTLQELP